MIRVLIHRACFLVVAAIAAIAIPALTTIPSQAQTATNGVCSNGAGAKMIQASVDYPELARIENARGTTVVAVTLDAAGGVATAAIKTSSGNHLLDEAALRGMRKAHFGPQIAQCDAVNGTYLVQVDWE